MNPKFVPIVINLSQVNNIPYIHIHLVLFTVRYSNFNSYAHLNDELSFKITTAYNYTELFNFIL